MTEEKSTGVTGAIGGWIKGILTSIVGLITGVVIMYLTPVVNNAVKPARPVANFAVQPSGLSVQFNNRSTGGVQGWWDFGDGSALEPFDPKAENIKHNYAKAGSYSVKLTLANLLGDESDRTATVAIDAVDGAAAVATGPAIDQFELTPYGRETVPAVYKLTSKVKNAGFCILSYGDNRPLEVVDAAASQERYVTFEEAGAFRVRLAAVNGKQLIEQTKTIKVGAGDGSAPLAKLFVTYEAVKVERLPPADWRIHCGWQADPKDSVAPFRKERAAEPGYIIASADLVNKDDKNPAVRNLKWEVSPDKTKVTVTGELVRPTGILAPKAAMPHWLADVKVVLERRSPPQTIRGSHVAMAVGMNTPTKLPIQPLDDRWVIVNKKLTLQLWEAGQKMWEGTPGATSATVAMGKDTCRVTAQPMNDGVLVTIAPAGPALRPVSFDRNPLLPKKGN
jgi:PKD repeat protein